MSQTERRDFILSHPDAQDCTLYRPDPEQPEAEEEDLGDARLVLLGHFESPADWSEQERADFFGEDDPSFFFIALLEPEAAPGSTEFFYPEPGDYVAAQPILGQVVMYYLLDWEDTPEGRIFILIQEDDSLLL